MRRLALFVSSALLGFVSLVPFQGVAEAVTFTVSNINDSGPASLRQAILDANGSPGLDTIAFNIPGIAPHTIQPLSALPSITDPAIVDGTTQPGFAGAPIIELDGSSAGAGANGLRITAGSSTVRGLVINGFAATGIVLSTNDGNVVEGNYIGTNVTGTLALGNGDRGVRTFNSGFNRIGTDGNGVADAAEANLISGNSVVGVEFFFIGGGNNIVAGNFIGTDVTGTAALGNGSHGVSVIGDSNRIGTNGDGLFDAAERNLISGNSGRGVVLFGDENVVAGNFVGTDVTGTLALGNVQVGVAIGFDSGSSGNLNRVGTNGDGVADAAERNLISGNLGHGIAVGGSNTIADDNVVAGNFIGTDTTGTLPLGNLASGVAISGNANRIGTNGDGLFDGAERNVISANSIGVGMGGDANVLAGNYIGTDVTGTAALGNSTGASIGGQFNRIGTDANGVADAAEANLISANLGTGVAISSGSSQAVVAGNFIGTDVTGLVALGNGTTGISVVGVSNRIGTDGDGLFDGAERNVISGNGSHGVSLNGDENVLAGNYIGTDVTGTVALGNGRMGVTIAIDVGSSGNLNRVGTNGDGVADAGERNVISGNGENGIAFGGVNTTADDNVVAGNFIGTDTTGTVALGNLISGVVINGNGNRIGTDGDGAADEAEGNTIAFNLNQGVVVGSGIQNPVRRNRIHSNGTLGIDLGPGGVNPNDAVDPDTGANDRQNFPVITLAEAGVTFTRVVGTLNSLATTSFTLEFFANPVPDPSGFGEGERFLGTATVTTDGFGDASFDVTLPAATSTSEFLTATATDPNGNTSEFSGTASIDPALEVEIDLKPGSNPSTVNLGSQGVTPLAVFGSAGFDATQIEISSLEINGQAANVAVKGKSKVLINFEDLNGDGFLDAVIKFDTEGLALTDNAPLVLTGTLLDSTPFTGEQPAGDPVNIVP